MNNPEQKQAVTHIINQSSRPAPYILYGPPGTGKTATLTEAICQVCVLQMYYLANITTFSLIFLIILKNFVNKISHKDLGKVLICTPSNAAADVLTKRLLKYVDQKEIYRVYSQSRDQ